MDLLIFFQAVVFPFVVYPGIIGSYAVGEIETSRFLISLGCAVAVQRLIHNIIKRRIKERE